MDTLKIYCMSLNNVHLNTIKSLGYTPVGLNKGTFSNEWLRDNTGENISHKNSYYGGVYFLLLVLEKFIKI